MHGNLRIITLLAALMASGSVAQALDAAKIDAIAQAADAFVGMAKDSHKTGQPPRQSDTAAKSLLDIVFDTRELERGPPVPWPDVAALNGWSDAVIKVGLVYFLAGTGVTELAALSQDPQAADKANRNTASFAPEFGRYSDAQLRLQGAIIDAVRAHLATVSRAQLADPDFRSGLTKIRTGVAETITGLLGAFVVDGATDEWRLARLAVAASIAPKAAKFVTPKDRQRVQYAAIEVADYIKDAKVKSGLEALAETFSP